MKKMLIRGGSIPAGVGVTKSYVDIVAPELLKDQIEVINRSRPKDTSFEGVWTFYEDIDIFKPEILVIHFGVDDIFRPVYRSEFKENMVQLVRLARQRFDPKIFLLTSHTFENSVAMDAANIFYKTIREVASDLDCMLVTVHLWWMSYIDESGKKLKDFVQSDSAYPNDEGHKIFAKILLEKVKTKLKTEKTDECYY
jgi:hypothetical protein